MQNSCSKTFIYLLVIAVVLTIIYSFVGYFGNDKTEVPLSQVVEQVKNKEVEKIVWFYSDNSFEEFFPENNRNL